jgi:peroxiredoxin
MTQQFYFRFLAIVPFLMMIALLPASAGMAMTFKPPESGDKAPDFTLPVPSGGRYTLSDSWLRDRYRVTIVSFYSFTCKPCIQELKHLQQLKSQLSAGSLNVLVVIVDPGSKRALESLRSNQIELPVVWDNMGIVAKRYGLQGLLPSCYVIDGRGRFIKKYCGNGKTTLQDIERKVGGLLK